MRQIINILGHGNFILWVQRQGKKLAALQLKLKTASSVGPMTDVASQAIVKKFNEPGALIVVGIKKSGDQNREREDYASLAAGLQNMALYLWSENLGTKWSTGKLTKVPETYSLMGIDPTQVEIFGLFWIGYAKTIPAKPERPNVNVFVTELP